MAKRPTPSTARATSSKPASFDPRKADSVDLLALYNPKKNERVSVKIDGVECPGIVTKAIAAKAGEGPRWVVALDDGRGYKVGRALLRPSDAPLPDHLKPKDFKKGDRVEFDYEGKVVHGTVAKGGTLVKVVADGGADTFGVDARNLRASNAPLPKDAPHPMDAWGLKGYSKSQKFSEETLCFSSQVTFNGKAVIEAKNDGQGGSNMYYPLQGGWATVEKFLEDAKQWLRDHGMPEGDIFEPGDNWIDWKANQQPYGVTAKAMVEADIARWKELRGDRDEEAAPGMK